MAHDNHRGWSRDEGRNEGLQDRSRHTDDLNRQSNEAQWSQSRSSGQGQGGYPGGQGGYGQSGSGQSGFGQGGSQGGYGQGGGQDYARGQNSYAPGAEIWQDGSNYNPSGYHQTSGSQGQGGFGASSGMGGNYGAGGFGGQGQGAQAADYGRQGQGGQHYSGQNFAGHQGSQGHGGQGQGTRAYGGESYGGPGQSGGFSGQGGGSYGVHDYSDSARRSTYRQDQQYPGAQVQHGYQGRQGHEDHDPDYLTWRDSQLSNYDRQYSEWREHQRKTHDEEYGRYRQERRESFGQKFHEWRSKAGSAVASAAGAVGLGGGSDKDERSETTRVSTTNQGGGAETSGGFPERTDANPFNAGDNPHIVDVADGGSGDRDPSNN